MKWERIDDYAMRSEPWTICAIAAGNGFTFELWHDKQPAIVGVFGSFDAAKAEAMKQEQEGRA